VIRLHEDEAARAHGRAQGLENREVVLLASVTQGGEDVQRAVEPALGQALAQVLAHVAQPRPGKPAALALGVLDQRFGLVHAHDDRPALRERTREPAVAAGCVQDAAAFLEAQERPEPLDLSAGGTRSFALPPEADVVGVEERPPPLAHGG
jgi:hypothetical protein